jgi:hypothetical protein
MPITNTRKITINNVEYNTIKEACKSTYNENSKCINCGNLFTEAAWLTRLKTGKDINNPVCRKCKSSLNKNVIINGIKYSNIKIAAESTYDVNKCKCIKCGNSFTYGAWYQRLQKDKDILNPLCHSCKVSESTINMNKINHEKNSRLLSNRNKSNWMKPEYRKKMESIILGNMHLGNRDPIYESNPKLYWEFYRTNVNHSKSTKIYIGYLYKNNDSTKSYRKLDGNKYFKLGITSDINSRKIYRHIDSGIDYYEILREFPNRRQATLCEYLAITNFASIGEACKINTLDDYVNFVNNFNYDKEKELIKQYLEKYYPEDL